MIGFQARIRLLISLAVCLPSLLSAQQWDWDLSTSAEYLLSNQDVNPFWFYTNSMRQRGSFTDVDLMIDGQVSYRFADGSVLEAGAAFYYRNDVPDELQRRDLFVEYRNNWLKATAGSQHRPVLYQDLSLTNRNFLNTGNARPLPGILVEAPQFIRISKNVSFDYGLGHYWLNDDRYVEDTWVHYKRLGLNYRFFEKNDLFFQIKHFAQWAGTSPRFGDLPDDFEAFVDVLFARKAPETGEEGEIQNAVGNHLGTYLLSYGRSFESGGRLELYHEHPFEDGSGSRLANFPDGTWGINYFTNQSGFVQGMVYEFIYTLDQTNSANSGVDNYFSNSIYRSGWSYERQIIGMPLFLYNEGWDGTGPSPIVSNRVRGHHFGFTGAVGLVRWKLKSTFVDQLGTFWNTLDDSFWFNYLEASYGTFFGELTFKLGLDAGNSIHTTFGGGIQYRYHF